ncbi:MAG: hypothetical protein ACYCPQ_03615 [Elusimicrobiota bacterium]
MHPHADAVTLQELFSKSRYFELAQSIRDADIAHLLGYWPDLEPMTKLAVFKLLAPSRAMSLYDKLSFPDRYFIFSGFHAATIAPILESLPISARKLFGKLSRWHYEKMFEGLCHAERSPFVAARVAE